MHCINVMYRGGFEGHVTYIRQLWGNVSNLKILTFLLSTPSPPSFSALGTIQSLSDLSALVVQWKITSISHWNRPYHGSSSRRRPVTGQGRVQIRASPSGICGGRNDTGSGRNDTGTVFLPVHRSSPVSIIPPMLHTRAFICKWWPEMLVTDLVRGPRGDF
jgi:hypothetical protein